MSTPLTVSIPTDDGPMPAFAARPDSETASPGAVIVIQEAFGVTPHIQSVASWLADHGFYAVAPALFHRQGSPVLDYGNFDKVMPIMQGLTAGGITTDLVATLEHLETAGFAAADSGVVGFCLGGSLALYAATLRPLGAAVTFYGGGVTQGRFGLPCLVDLAPVLATPWLGLFGDLDQSIPVEDVESLRRSASSAPVPTEIVRYPDATHGFNCDDRPDAFNPESSADARRRTLDWFTRHLN